MLLWFELWSNFDLSLCSNRSKEWENRKGFAALLLVEASTGTAALQKLQDGRTSESCTISILIRYKANTESWQVRLKRIFWKFEIPWKSMTGIFSWTVMLSCCHAAVAALTKDLFVAEPSPSVLEKLPRTTQEFLVFGIPEVEQVELNCELELNWRRADFSWHSQRPSALTFWSTHPWRFLWDTDKYIDIQLQFIISYVAPCVT